MTPSQCLRVNLSIIGSLLPHQRLDAMSGVLRVEGVTWLPQCVSRWWRDDNRRTCLRRINEIFVETQLKIDIANQVQDTNGANKLLAHIDNARPGLNNLKQTYAADMTSVAHIELLLDMCNDLLIINRFTSTRSATLPQIVATNVLNPESDDESEE